MRIICCIYKLFVRPLKASTYRPSVIHVLVKLQTHFAQILYGAFAQDSRILGFDHLKWTCAGTFERLLARGDRECEQQFSKKKVKCLRWWGGGWSFDLTDTLGNAYSDVSGNSKAKQLTGSRWRAVLPCKEKRRHCHGLGLRHVRTWVLLLFWELFWRQLRNA